MFFSNTDYYDILGVTRTASQENIYKAYDRLINGDDESRVPSWLRANVEKAYSVLGDIQKRATYDEYLSKNSVFVTDAKSFDEYLKEKEAQQNFAFSADTGSSQSEQSTDQTEEVNESALHIEQSEQAAVAPETRAQEELSDDNPEINLTDSVGEATKAEETIKEEEPKVTTYNGRVYHEVEFVSNVNLADGKKYKLQKDKSEKKITDVKIQEKEATIAYLEVLNQALNKMISEPHSHYRIEMTLKKYELQIEYLKKLLDIKMNRKVNGFWDRHWNKLEVIAVAKEIAAAKKEMEGFEKKLAEYSINNAVDLKRDKWLKNKNVSLSDNIEEIERLKATENPKKIKIKNLEIKSPKIQKGRDALGENLKAKVYRDNNRHEVVGNLKALFAGHYFTNLNNVDDVVDSIINPQADESVKTM